MNEHYFVPGDYVRYDPQYFVGNSTWRANRGKIFVVVEDCHYDDNVDIAHEEWAGFFPGEIPANKIYKISREGLWLHSSAEPSWEL